MNDELSKIKTEFDWNLYIYLNPNLKSIIKNEHQAWYHFQKFGYKNNFKWKIDNNNNNTKILIVMPTYNRAKNIDNIVSMILSQIFTNWFFLIIDDGSTEDNICIFEQTQEKYKNNTSILFVKNETNCGIGKTLNRGINYLLQHDFTHFTWISDDNIYYNNFLNILISNNTFFNYTSYDIVYGNNITNGILHNVKCNYNDYIDLINNWKGCASFMWSKDAIIMIGFYNEFIQGCEDFDYIIRTFKINNGCCNFIKISTMKYFIHDNSLYTLEKKTIIELTNKIVKHYLEHNTLFSM